jgi:hypothetical protein
VSAKSAPKQQPATPMGKSSPRRAHRAEESREDQRENRGEQVSRGERNSWHRAEESRGKAPGSEQLADQHDGGRGEQRGRGE